MRRGQKGIASLALVALLAFAISVLAGPAASASGGNATASSLHSCLKKANKIKNKAKRKRAKRKCHKKFPPPEQPTQLVRATLTWSSDTPSDSIDLDLWVFDSNGNKARAAADTIPNSSFSGNHIGSPGSETFTDLAFTKSGARKFSYAVCYQDGGSQHVTWHLDYVTADGQHHTGSQEYGSSGISTTFDGGAPIPANFCPAP